MKKRIKTNKVLTFTEIKGMIKLCFYTLCGVTQVFTDKKEQFTY